MPRSRSARARTLTVRPTAPLTRTSIPPSARLRTSTGVGGYATAELTNNGAISIEANANAFGGREAAPSPRRRSAPALPERGSLQQRRGQHDEQRTLERDRAASASGDEDATAIAGIGGGTGSEVKSAAVCSRGNASGPKAMLPRRSSTTARPVLRRPMRSAAKTCTQALCPRSTRTPLRPEGPASAT